MAGLIEAVRRLISPEAAEKGAEDDVISRAPEGTRGRLMAFVQRRRQQEQGEKERARVASMPEGVAKDRMQARESSS